MEQPKEDEWTQVTAKKGRKDRQMHFPVPRMDRTATVASLTAEFNNEAARWQSSQTRSHLYDCLRHLAMQEQTPITKAVCMGVGNFSIDHLQLRTRSMLQLAAFIDLTKHLETIHGTKVVLYAQEPRFTQVDKAFLASLGITTLKFDLVSNQGDTNPVLGPAEAHMTEDVFVADFFMGHAVARQLASYKIGLLFSAMPGVVETWHQALSQHERETWTRRYRWYRLTLDMDGLYVCALNAEEEEEELEEEQVVVVQGEETAT